MEVDDATLAGLDLLEGISTGHYYRSSVLVEAIREGTKIQCNIYFRRSDAQLLLLDHHSLYSVELHATYTPPRDYPDPKIILLMEDKPREKQVE